MEITGEYQIANSRGNVWKALNDPATLQKCIPGCESLQKISDTELEAKVAAAIGPVRATFNSRLRLENLNPPESYTLSGEGKAGAAGFGRGKADVTLAERHGGTVLRYVAEFKVGGKLAQVGSRLVLGASKKTADDFFARLSLELDPQAARIDKETEGIRTASIRSSNVVRAVLLATAILLIWWFLLR